MGMNTNALKVYTVKEVAQILQTSRQQIRRMIQNEELEAVRVGREWRISENTLKAFLDNDGLHS